MVMFIALLGLAENLLVSYDNDNDEDWDDTAFNNVDDPTLAVHVATNIIVPVYIAMCILCLALTITEIVLLARHKLRPLAFLIINVVKSAIWTGLFVLDIISAVTAGGRTTSVVGIIIDSLLLYVSFLLPISLPLADTFHRLGFWAPLIYGSVIYHRFRKEKTSYKPVDHPYSNPVDVHTSYDSQYSQPIAHKAPEVHGDIESQSNTVTGRARNASFNHERDTRYDTYRKSAISSEQPAMETFESRSLVSGEGIPQVYVEHHDGDAFEMESRRELR